MRFAARSIPSITTSLQNAIRNKLQIDPQQPIPGEEYKSYQQQLQNKISQKYDDKNRDIQQQLHSRNVNMLWAIWHDSLVKGVQEFFRELEADITVKSCDPQVYNDIGGPTFVYEPQFQQ
eukprot:6424683-Karenia_brevis.AAC.1